MGQLKIRFNLIFNRNGYNWEFIMRKFNYPLYQTPISQLISRFRFHSHCHNPIIIKRSEKYDVTLGTLSEAQTLLGYPAKPIPRKELVAPAKIVEEALALSMQTNIGEEVFKTRQWPSSRNSGRDDLSCSLCGSWD